MPMLRGMRSFLLPLALVGMVATLGCKEEPMLVSASEAAVYGGVEFRLGQYSIQYLELSDESGQTYSYPDPVFVVPLTVANRGEDSIEYRPVHGVGQMSEATTPLLYPAPVVGEDGKVDWATFTRRPISGVNIERGRLAGQQRQARTLQPGDEVTDLYLFGLPERTQSSLVFSVPPTMHRGELPVLLQIDYREPVPQGPKVYAVGEEIDFDGLTFTVTGVSQEFIKVEDTAQGAGYSTEPVIKVAYSIENKTESPVSYDPAHRDVTGRQGALLQSLHTKFNRARFPATATPEGQKNRVQIAAGETITDYAIFERPDQDVESATFELAASHFGRAGRVRVAFGYEKAEVKQPEEMTAQN